MPLFFLGTREWRNRQTRTVQVRVPVMEWGFNSPLAHDETADPSGSAVFVFPGCGLWPRWCSGRRRARLWGRAALWGPAAVCAGGRRPAREIATREPAARSGRSRGPPWPCRHPPAPRQIPSASFAPVGPGCAMGGGPPARRPRRFARWLVVGAGLAGAGYGLFASVRWAAGLVETWKGRGMPMWPSWRER